MEKDDSQCFLWSLATHSSPRQDPAWRMPLNSQPTKFQAAAHQPQPSCEFHIWGHTYEWSTTHQPGEAYVPWGCWCTVLDVLLWLFVCISFIIVIVQMIILFTILILILAIARVATSGSRSSWLPPYLEIARHPMQHHSWSATNCQLLYRQSRDWKRVVVLPLAIQYFKYALNMLSWSRLDYVKLA